MNPDQNQIDNVQDQLDDVLTLVKKLKDNPFLPDHFHTGTDVSQVNFANVYQKKVWISYTIYGTAAATAGNYGVFFIAPFKCYINKIQEVHQTAGSDAGAVTLTIEKLTGTQALDAGVSTLNSTINLKGTANTVVTPTLTQTTANRNLDIGNRLAMDDAGALADVANVTVEIELIITAGA